MGAPTHRSAAPGAHDPARDAAVRRVLVFEGMVNLLVMVAKGTAGVATGSLALLSDALHSLTDVGNNVIAFLVMRHAGRPPDHNHPYGHRKFETLAVFGLAMLLVVLAVELILRVIVGDSPTVVSQPWALAVMLGAMAINLALGLWEAARARALQSDILHADAGHTLADVCTTGAVIAGWQLAARGYAWAESLATLLVALLVLVLSYRLFKRAIPVLVDEGVADPEAFGRALRAVPGVRDLRQVRSRWIGDQAFADVVVGIDAHLSTEEGHEIADRIEAALAETLGVHDVSVHLEPVESTGSAGA